LPSNRKELTSKHPPESHIEIILKTTHYHADKDNVTLLNPYNFISIHRNYLFIHKKYGQKRRRSEEEAKRSHFLKVKTTMNLLFA
jgi:hypothetical protein